MTSSSSQLSYLPTLPSPNISLGAETSTYGFGEVGDTIQSIANDFCNFEMYPPKSKID